jgi:hypothetical protein
MKRAILFCVGAGLYGCMILAPCAVVAGLGWFVRGDE